jgi:hypothetical protein
MRNFLKKYNSKDQFFFGSLQKDLMMFRMSYDHGGFSRSKNFYNNLQIVFPLYGSKLSFFKTQGKFIKQRKKFGLNQTITIECRISKNKI